MKLPEPPHLRELNRGDEQECNLVIAGWLRTYVGTQEKPSSVDLTIERGVMFKLYQPLVKALMARSSIVVACMPEARDVVYGWVAFECRVIHYICTKPKWQRLGIAGFLLRDFVEHPVTYTHDTTDGRKLLAATETKVPWAYAPMAKFEEAAA